MTERRMAVVKVTLRGLEQALALPQTTRLVRVLPETVESFSRGVVELLVEDPRLRVVPEGAVVPVVEMRITSEIISLARADFEDGALAP